jgi:hypothetical protein
LSLFCRLSKVLSFWFSLVACEKIEDSNFLKATKEMKNV